MEDDKQSFYVTFGQVHPLRNYFVRVCATDKARARQAVLEILGQKWAFLYSQTEMEGKEHFFPGGVIGRTIEGE